MRDTFFHRTLSFFVLAVFLIALAMWAAPQLFGVTVYKLGLVFASASAGYWIDRVTFPYARPDKILEHIDYSSADDADDCSITMVGSLRTDEFSFATLRRAIIMAACMICVGLGA